MIEIPKLRLSKSRFTAGVQCHKYLWWKVHEPDAEELQPDIVLNDRFDQGRQVGELATTLFPGGISIDLPFYKIAERVDATQQALHAGAPSIYEATFFADTTYVAIDVLERLGNGFRLVEVKSSTSQKDEHIPDAAVQKHVATASGLDIVACEIMHLNKEYRHPEGDLFTRADVTTPVGEYIGHVQPEIKAQLTMLGSDLPDVEIGAHCFDPRDCPFMGRCWPDTTDHIINLYNVGGKKAAKYMHEGIHSLSDLPADAKLPEAAQRQMQSYRSGKTVVDPGLAEALEPFNARLGHLDFETIQRAVPVWDGLGPWHQAAAQFSFHLEDGYGGFDHFQHLAEGPLDARPALAHAMIGATANAERVVHYSAFEKTRIKALQKSVPELEAELKELELKLIDLLPVVRNNVYHPDFRGSFSLKNVQPTLVPELQYSDLVIVDGMVASVEIARLLFVAGKLRPEQHEKTRHDLLEYCKRDTWATVRVLDVLRQLAQNSP